MLPVVVGGIIAVLIVSYVVSLIAPYLIGAAILIGLGAVIKGGKRG